MRSSASTTVTRGAQLRQRHAELEPDVAAADDGHVAGTAVERERGGRVQHALAVEGQGRQGDRPRARGHDRVRELEEDDAVLGRADRRAIGAVEARVAVQHAHAAARQQRADAAAQGRRTTRRAGA